MAIEQKVKPKTMPLAYRPGAAAVALGVTSRTVYRMIDRGHLRTTKIGGVRLIPAEDIQAIIAGAA
ncbi:helix-turn-helix domain-containing protein [Sphingobium rhizovicinum]|uniref:Helix-turn-helix domain-containing protein n=1 Tax=Sphingobium rhizovicinum TaxID=432308 RepID=A0ABV7NE83_9SPHN